MFFLFVIFPGSGGQFWSFFSSCAFRQFYGWSSALGLSAFDRQSRVYGLGMGKWFAPFLNLPEAAVNTSHSVSVKFNRKKAL